MDHSHQTKRSKLNVFSKDKNLSFITYFLKYSEPFDVAQRFGFLHKQLYSVLGLKRFGFGLTLGF